MKKVALVSVALIVASVFSPPPVSASSSKSLASVFPHEIVHTPEGDYVIYFIEEDILIEVPSSMSRLDATPFEQLDELIAVFEQQTMTCNGVKTTEDGTSGDDTNMDGSSLPDVMHGYAGNDDIDGFGSTDRLCGGRGNDVVRGGTGDDHVIGGPGHDEIRGGSGIDTLEAKSGNDDAYDGHGSDDIDLVDGVTGDQLYRCADSTEDVWATDDDEVEVTEVPAQSSYC